MSNAISRYKMISLTWLDDRLPALTCLIRAGRQFELDRYCIILQRVALAFGLAGTRMS